MIDTLTRHGEAPLNTYNIAQLSFALDEDSKNSGIDSLHFDVHAFHQPLSGTASPAILSTSHSSDAEIDYSSRRMSSSAASDSSLHSRPDKRSFDYSPSASPIPKKQRQDEPEHHQQWSPQPNQDQDSRSDYNSNSPRVQLPSIASSLHERLDGRRGSLPTNLADSALSRQTLRLPHPGVHRTSLSSYQFPESDNSDEKRPRLAADTTQLGLYADYSVPSTALSSSSSYSYSTHSPLSGAPSAASEENHWAPTIVRPSSTPSQLSGNLSPNLKYDDSLRHSSLTGQSLYGGVTRISGQSHHLNSSTSERTASSRNGLASGIKTESDWTFPSHGEYSMSPPSSNATATNNSNNNNMPSTSAPAISVTTSPTRSPQAQSATSSLVDRPPRKRGKLPKPVTDFLKDWLHRHSDHPYPSEEEKKQLCHATGLSMSQVSNWMINARRRILAPAHRAAQGPTTNSPYATQVGRSVLDTGRRASMPTDSLALYHPMSLQSLPDYASSSTRHLVGMTRSMSSGHASVGSLSAAAGHHPYGMESSYSRPSLYGGSTLHPSAHAGSGSSSYLGVPLSAPASMSNPNPFLGNSQSHQYSNSSSNGYGSRVSPESHTSQARYSFPEHGHSVSPGPGSGYNTPH